MSDGRHRLNRLRWKSRRGLKELDVLLEAFFSSNANAIASGDWPELEKFLAQEDDVLFDWITGRGLTTNPNMLNLINTITNAAKHSSKI
jgi:antitoxin CptB